MSVDIRHNAPQVEQALRDYVRRFPVAQKIALGIAGESLFVASKRHLTRLVYNQEIPRRKNGRLAWRRKMHSGGLLGAETYSLTADGSEFTVFTNPSSPSFRYHIHRHNLNRPSRIDSKTRRAPWRTEAVRQDGPRAARKFRGELEKQMNASGWRSQF